MNESRFNFQKLQIQDSLGIGLREKTDDRGSLTRIWDSNAFSDKYKISEISIVNNPVSYTLRGLHFQKEPFAENKIVYCVYGRVFDVLVDLRTKSKTYLQHTGVEIGPDSQYQGMYIPAGCAHGYLTLNSNSTLIYFMDKHFSETNSFGIRWDDPKFRISWPNHPILVSERDAKLPYFKDL